MNYRIFTLLLSMFFLNVLSFAQVVSAQGASQNPADPVEFGRVKFEWKKLQNNDKYIKSVLQLRCKGDLDAKASGSNADWLKDVDISFICAFEGEKNAIVWVSSKASFYALKRNTEYYLNFYVPVEVAAMHSFKADPIAYMIELSANGKTYPLNASNYTKRSNLNASNVKSFMEAASSNTDNGLMLYYEEAPYAIKLSDKLDSKQMPPTSKPKK